MNPSPHPADISLATPVRLAVSRQVQPNILSDRFGKRQRRVAALTVATTVGTLLVGLGLTFAVTSLAGGGAPAVTRMGAEPVTGLLVSRILPVGLGVLIGGGLGWLRRSRPVEGW